MTDTILTILTSPAFLGVLGTILTAGVNAFLASAWWKAHTTARRELAIEIMKAAALKLMPLSAEYKTKSAGGKLTDAQKQDLLLKLEADVEVIGKQMGVDVIKTIGPEFVQLALHESVEHLKGVPKLSAAVAGLLR